MAADRYRHSEEEYYKLRGQFDTGRITQEQFDEKLRELMVQDAQGRYWMLGADSGKWYFYDGTKWVQGVPYSATAPIPPAAAAAAVPVVSPTPAPIRPAAATNAATGDKRGLPLIPILVLILMGIVAIAAFWFFQNREQIFIAQRPQEITPILPATITRAPSPTPPDAVATAAALGTAVQATLAPGNPVLVTEVPTLPVPSDAPTQIPATQAPVNTIIPVTVEPIATIELPTLLPTATLIPTLAPTETSSPIPVTVTPPPANTALPNVPAGVYVTDLNVAPLPARRNQEAAFSATFLNTTGGPMPYEWLVLLYDPTKTGPNPGFGESTPVQVTVPPGESILTVNHVPARGGGGCIPLYASAGFRVGQFEKPLFPNISGSPATVFFDVCPP